MNAPPNAFRLALRLSSPLDEFPAKLKPVLESHPGETPVVVEASAPGWSFDLLFGKAYRVTVSAALVAALCALPGCKVLTPMPTPAAPLAPPAAPGDFPVSGPKSRRFAMVPADVEAFALSLSGRSKMRLQAVHEYTRADGSPWWWVARLKDPTTGDKRPLQFHRGSDSAFVGKMPVIPDGARPLYRLHKLGQYPSDVVYLVEGERCADCLEALGFLAATWSNGATRQSIEKTDWSPLAGRMAFLWPDNDAPGFEAMRTIRGILEDLDCTTATVDVDALGLPPKGDAVDWVRAFVAKRGALRLHEIPNGYARIWHELDSLPMMEERVVAA